MMKKLVSFLISKYYDKDTTHTCDAIEPLYSRRRDGQNKTHRRISERIWYLMVFCGIFGHT